MSSRFENSLKTPSERRMEILTNTTTTFNPDNNYIPVQLKSISLLRGVCIHLPFRCVLRSKFCEDTKNNKVFNQSTFIMNNTASH